MVHPGVNRVGVDLSGVNVERDMFAFAFSVAISNGQKLVADDIAAVAPARALPIGRRRIATARRRASVARRSAATAAASVVVTGRPATSLPGAVSGAARRGSPAVT